MKYTYFLYWIIYVCVAQRKFQNQDHKNICIDNDSENIIAYWKESKQNEALADKCDSFHTVKAGGF